MAGKTPNAPRHLSPANRRVWREIVSDYGLATEPHAMLVLTRTLEADDRCKQARDILNREGLTVIGAEGGVKTHPCVAVERDSRIAVLRGFRELSLDSQLEYVPRFPVSNGAVSR